MWPTAISMAPAPGPAAPVAKPYSAGLQSQAMNPEPSAALRPASLARDAGPPTPARGGLRRRRTVAGLDPNRQATAPTLPPPWCAWHPAQRTAPLAPGLPFDDKIYTLGTRGVPGKPQPGRRLGRRPGRRAAKSRRCGLARTAGAGVGWTLRLDVALENWLAVARQTQKESAWQAVLRLAPGQFDDTALVGHCATSCAASPTTCRSSRPWCRPTNGWASPSPHWTTCSSMPAPGRPGNPGPSWPSAPGSPTFALQSWRRLLSNPPGHSRARHARCRAGTHPRAPGRRPGLAGSRATRPPTTPDTATGFLAPDRALAESRQRAPLAIAAYRKLLGPRAPTGDFDSLIRMLLLDYPWRRHRYRPTPGTLPPAPPPARRRSRCIPDEASGMLSPA